MPYSKNPDNYPTEFRLLWEKAIGQAEDLRIPCASESEAFALRHRLNAFRRAMVDSKSPGWSTYTSFVLQVENNQLVFSNQSRALKLLLGDKVAPLQGTTDEILDYEKQLDQLMKGTSNEQTNTGPAVQQRPAHGEREQKATRTQDGKLPAQDQDQD